MVEAEKVEMQMANKIRELTKRKITTKESKRNFSFKDIISIDPVSDGNEDILNNVYSFADFS